MNAADVARTQYQYLGEGGGGGDSRPTGDRVCYLDRTSYRSALGSKAISFYRCHMAPDVNTDYRVLF